MSKNGNIMSRARVRKLKSSSAVRKSTADERDNCVTSFKSQGKRSIIDIRKNNPGILLRIFYKLRFSFNQVSTFKLGG